MASHLAIQRIRSYALDLPLGAHPTALRPDVEVSSHSIARQMIAFLDKLNLPDVTLVGNDTGGAICQFLIDLDHTRVGRLVLTNCDAFDKFPPPFGLVLKAARRPGRVKFLMPSMRPAWARHAIVGYGPLGENLLRSP